MPEQDFANRMPDEVLEAAFKTNAAHDVFIHQLNLYDGFGERSATDTREHKRNRNAQGIAVLVVKANYQSLVNEMGYLLASHNLLPLAEANN